MLTFIIFSVIVIGCILWAIFDDWDFAIPCGIGSIALVILLISILSLCNREKRFEKIKENYENVKMQVEDYSSLPDSLQLVSVEYDLRKNVLEMNNEISEHKVMSKSLWTGPWYSEDVGNLEKLHLKKR